MCVCVAVVSMALGLGQNGEARPHQRVMGVMRAVVRSLGLKPQCVYLGKDSRVQRGALGAWMKAVGA